MGDSASKALKEYEQILTGGSGKMGRNLNKDSFSNITLKRLCSNFFSLYNLSLDARYALKSSGQPDDEHKNFLDEFTKLRTFLLEEFDTNWCNLSENEKERVSQIHQYFCHLHVSDDITSDKSLKTCFNVST
jgi:hypothetical protein